MCSLHCTEHSIHTGQIVIVALYIQHYIHQRMQHTLHNMQTTERTAYTTDYTCYIPYYIAWVSVNNTCHSQYTDHTAISVYQQPNCGTANATLDLFGKQLHSSIPDHKYPQDLPLWALNIPWAARLYALLQLYSFIGFATHEGFHHSVQKTMVRQNYLFTIIQARDFEVTFNSESSFTGLTFNHKMTSIQFKKSSKIPKYIKCICLLVRGYFVEVLAPLYLQEQLISRHNKHGRIIKVRYE